MWWTRAFWWCYRLVRSCSGCCVPTKRSSCESCYDECSDRGERLMPEWLLEILFNIERQPLAFLTLSSMCGRKSRSELIRRPRVLQWVRGLRPKCTLDSFFGCHSRPSLPPSSSSMFHYSVVLLAGHAFAGDQGVHVIYVAEQVYRHLPSRRGVPCGCAGSLSRCELLASEGGCVQCPAEEDGP